MQETTITTEVDRLVILVNEKGRISAKDAARKLNMPISTINEWATFLEEEEIIEIEYNFTTPFLVRKKLTHKEVEQIKENIDGEKEILDRKSESTIQYLNKLEVEVNYLRDIFNDLEKHFNKRFSNVKGRIR